jgi:hypothetical protein
MSSRSIIQRSSLVLGLIALSAFLFYIGKGHTLLIDTNAVTINGQEFKSAETISVSVDGKEPESMGRAERIMLTVAGPRHRVLIEVESGDAKKVEKSFRISTWLDTAVVSVPAILGDAPSEHWVTKFVPPPMEEAPAEQMQQQDENAPAMAAPGTFVAAPGTPATP